MPKGTNLWTYSQDLETKKINKMIRALNAALVAPPVKYKKLCQDAVDTYTLRGSKFFIKISIMEEGND